MRVVLLLGLLLSTPLDAQVCPNVDPAAGYPVSAAADSGVASDSTWLGSAARAAAYRWRVPSRRRNAYEGWERVKRRLLPPEPRWADDWSPEASHRAVLRVVLFRDGRKSRGNLIKASGDDRFDESLQSIVNDPMPASPSLPPFPGGVSADSVAILFTFGELPNGGVHDVVRFAAAQTRIELDRSSVRPMALTEGATEAFRPVTVKYDVMESGAVDLQSIEFLNRTSTEQEARLRDFLRGARFRAPTSNCRRISQTVVQTFGR